MHLFWNNQLAKFNKSKLPWDLFGYNVFFKTIRGRLTDQLKAAEGHLATKISGQLVDVLHLNKVKPGQGAKIRLVQLVHQRYQDEQEKNLIHNTSMLRL